MKKDTLERFIRKYHLNGLTGAVVWTINNGALKVMAMNKQKSLFAEVTWGNATDEDDAEITILDTRRLLRMLKVCDEDISLELNKDKTGAVKSLVFNRNVELRTSSLSSVEIQSMRNIPPFNITIQLDKDFRRCFSKSLAALGGNHLFTVKKSQRANLTDVVVGPSHRKYADIIAIHVDVVEYNSDMDVQPFFIAKNLKEVLAANSECENPLFKVCDAGLASISFSDGDLDATYYLVKVDVED